MTRIQPRLRSEHGTAMVEMALVMPILLFLALGIVDFGRAINYWNDANQLAADGARYAAVNKNPGADTPSTLDNDFRHWIRLQADTEELRDGTIAGGSEPSPSTTGQLRVCVGKPGQGSPATGDFNVGKPVEVVVETNYNLIPFLDRETKFGSVKIRGTAVMRLEQNYTMATGCTS